MQYKSGNQIREDFLRFFETKAHRRVHSSSLIPQNDPTLLFTNAGMNQFKDVFLGAERRDYSRAASSQKCVRAGGKHNDLENVGFTRRHHTFFEMLGNFSFGDYFKCDAIAYAWELLTSPQWFGIDPARLYVTIFEGDAAVPRDDEAERLWIETGVPADRIFEMSAKDNFWQMGETGPCGPCSEIFYDLGLAASEHFDASGQPVDKPFPEDDQRYVEIWNLVFMQFDRSITPEGPHLAPLPKPSIDTGMGLERIATVLQGVISNYETDIFLPLLARAAQLTNFAATAPASRHSDPDPEHREGEGEESPHSAGSATTPGALSIAPLSLAMGGVSFAEANDRTPSEQASMTGESPTSQNRDVGHPAFTYVPPINEASSRPTNGSGETPAFAFDPAWALSDAKGFASLRIIADHARAATFLISDGVLTANEGRGYVLRKILRRGIRHGRLLGQEQPFMHQMVLAVRDEMQVAYPELKDTAERVAKVVLAEEEQFGRVMSTGLYRLEEEVSRGQLETVDGVLKELVQTDHATPGNDSHRAAVESLCSLMQTFWGRCERASRESQARYFEAEYRAEIVKRLSLTLGQAPANEIANRLFAIWPPPLPGRLAFYLYETFGLPIDFIVEVTRDFGIATDLPGFERAKQEEQARARASWKGGSQKSASPAFRELPKTAFEGHTALRVDGVRILALVKDGLGVPALAAGETGEAVLDATSFYADSGGQVGDIGQLISHGTIVAEVLGATKPVQGVFAHRIVAKQPLAIGDVVDTVVNAENRRATERNHTGTHLLHAALREVLGPHVKQAGSLNDPTRLRFDFSHFAGIAEPELREVESIVNTQVLANEKVETLVDVPIDVAVNELGAMALFGEKYGERVRVVKIGGFSTELCGGTHTAATGEIGLIKITGENSVSSGVRRVEALSGTGALAEFRRGFELSRAVAQLAGSGDPEALRHKLSTQDEELKKLRRELDQLRMKAASASVSDAAGNAVEVNGVKVLSQRVDALDKSQMRDLVDQLRTKLGSGVVILGAASEGRVTLIVGVTKDLTARLQAGKIVGLLAAKVGGKGGGRPDLAEAGGSDPSALDSTLIAAPLVVGSFL